MFRLYSAMREMFIISEIWRSAVLLSGEITFYNLDGDEIEKEPEGD